MKKNEVEIGKVYIVKVSGLLTRVKVTRLCQYGGWYGENLATRREVRIRTAARLRREHVERPTTQELAKSGELQKALNG